ncbi:penicillin-binding protein 1B [Hahella ganghwensis]|uniref:penicillin-binding protein 1B n=1 Tax=Hahella ganghwensis TaxID=286420 RepID=UPI00037F3A62|nr:penicillin-binding protein 1B [Hahella ganghwensis]
MPKTRKNSTRSRKSTSQKASRRHSRWKSAIWKVLLVCLTIFLGWCVYLDATVRDKFDGKRWQLPAQVFARPLEIYPGLALVKADLQAELAELGYERRTRADRPGTFAAGSYAVEIYSRGFQYADGAEKPRRIRVEFSGDKVSQLLDSGGRALTWARLEPVKIGGIYPAQQEDRILVNLDQLPDMLEKALIQVEDRHFYSHFGVSPQAIARATWANIRAGRVVQGGSTLTQQLVKNFYLTNEQSLWRKANEALMALILEFHYDKDEILEAYANEIYLGQAGARGIHGFGMASHFYFGKSVSDLTSDQIALLVAIVKGASYYDPRRHPERAKERRNLVLDQMAEANVISDSQANADKARRLNVIPKPRYSSSAYPAFMDVVKQQLTRDYREEDLQSEGLRVFTTLDPLLQAKAEKSLSDTIRQKEQTAINQGLQGAMITTAVSSGEILAVVGDRQANFSGFNRALLAKRQIGSLIKPFVMLTALKHSQKYTLASPLDDEPFMLKFENGDEWMPKNYDGESHGPVIMQEALARSLNLATARLGLEVGVPEVLETIRELGADVDVRPYPAVLLGALNLSPMEVTELYQNLISTGFRTPLRAIRAVTTSNGELLSRYSFDTEQVIDSGIAYIGQYGLFEVMRNGTGRSVYRTLPEDYYVGGKTGTTDDYRDSWFVGFNGQYLTTVWLGKDDNTSTSLTGSSGALAAWLKLYRQLPQVSFLPSAPESVEWAWVDQKNGLLSAEHCEGAVALPFLLDTVPEERAGCVDRGNILERWLRKWWNS